ncbi:MAG: hypothetical protein U0M06_04675 [Clostridia bacterium]|nr:hypothetical protein [Clostridia bacterium]
MKKERFLDLVSEELQKLGISEDERIKQRKQISSYLSSLGIEEEAEELDHESPKDFAQEIFGVISQVHSKTDEPDQLLEHTAVFDIPTFSEAEEYADEYSEEYSEEYAEYNGDEKLEDSADVSESYLDGEPDVYYENVMAEDGATREFDIRDIIEEDISESDYYEDEDDDYDDDYSKPKGNPVFFYIIAIVLSPLWVSLGVLGLLMIPVCYLGLIMFTALYIPILIVLILGGSVASIAGLVYSVLKFTGGETGVGFFELGISFLIAASVLCLSVIIYRAGTKYSPRAIKKYPRTVKKMLKKVRRLVRKIGEVCSI